MKRKDFLLAGLATLPTLALATPFSTSEKKKSNPTPFVVDAGKSRFGEVVMFKGVNNNDLKISSKDTGGQLSVFEYIGTLVAIKSI